MTDFAFSVAQFALRTVAPLVDALDDPARFQLLLRELGWRADVDDQVTQALTAAGGLADALEAAINNLTELQSSPTPDPAQIASLITSGLDLIKSVTTIDQLSSAVDSPPFNQPKFWASLAADLPGYLLCRQLARDLPILHGLLLLIGVITYTEVAAPDSTRLPYRQATVAWDQLSNLFADPATHLADLYGWGASFNHALLASNLDTALVELGFPVRRVPPSGVELARWPAAPPADVRQLVLPLWDGEAADGGGYLDLGLRLTPIPATGSATADGLDIAPYLGAGEQLDLSLGGPVHLQLSGELTLDGGVEILWLPGSVRLEASAPDGQFDVTAKLAYQPPSPQLLVGDPNGSRILLGTAWIALEAIGTIESGTAEAELVAQLGVGDKQLQIVVQVDPDDGLLGRILSTQPQTIMFGAALAWSSQRGFTMSGNLGLVAKLPLRASFGPVTISGVEIGLDRDGDQARGYAGVSGGLATSALTLSVDRVGVSFTLEPRSGGDGNNGQAEFEFAFLPPRGIGLSINAPLVTGGGFLDLDPAGGRYAGGLQLAIEQLSLAAIGLINTKTDTGAPIQFPDGKPGYSLVIIIAASFPPIQLGMGFALSGIGGLLGYNRTMNVNALRSGVRSKALDTVLFPQNPAGQIDKLINTIAADFPVALGRLVIGPMVQITWGDPTIATIDLAVLIEVPEPIRIVLLGRLHIALPQDDTSAVVTINLDAVGVLDLSQGQLSLDATIYDSRIAGFTLSGDMALRLSWQGQRQFMLSLGGWHPAFTPPNGFPALRRVTIALSQGNNPQLSLSAYFAVTSNTVQFGAQASLRIATAGAVVAGSLSFDTLVTFSPFGVEIDFAASVSLSFDGVTLLAVGLTGTLSGPAPWRLHGQASFAVLGFNAHVSFDTSFGTIAAVERPSRTNVLDLIAAEVAKPANWSASLPVAALVQLRDPPAGQLRVHPLATLAFHQRIAPLGVAMTHYGQDVIDGPTTVSLTAARVATGPSNLGPTVTDDFAPANFLTLNDAQKLSAPSFVTEQAGATVAELALDIDQLGASEPADLDPTLLWDDPAGEPPSEPSVTSAQPTSVAATLRLPARPAVRLTARPSEWSRLTGVTS